MRRQAPRLIPLILLACSGPLESTHRQADLFGRIAIKLYVLDEERGAIATAARELTTVLNGPESLLERRTRFATPIPEDAVVLGTRAAFEAAGASFAPPAQVPESFRIQISEVAGRKSVYVVGADAPGVLYGSLELCEQLITRSNLPVLQRPQAVAKAPPLRRRGVALTVTAPAEAGDWWFRNEDLWRGFLDDLARARFNRLDLQGPWLLPWLVVPAGYEHRTVARAEADLNLRALARLVDLAGDRGIDVGLLSLGTAPWLAWHGTAPAAADVAMAGPFLEQALPVLCARLPRLRALGFGPGPGDSEETVLAALRQVLQCCGPRVECLVPERAVPVPAVAELDRQWPGRVSVAESFGPLPLGYPQHADQSAVHLSGRGGARLFWTVALPPWLPSADPDLVRRAIPGLRLLDAEGLALQLGDGGASAERLLRSWPTLFVWGRLASDPLPAAEALTASFRDRFGSEAGPHVQEALALVSRLVAQSATLRGDAAAAGDGLDAWSGFEPADPRWQMGPREFAIRAAWAAGARAPQGKAVEASMTLAGRLAGTASGRRTPIEAADQLLGLADRALAALTTARPLVRTRAGEFAAHAAGAEDVVRLARGAAHRAKAGTCMALYWQTLDPQWLEQCAAALRATELPGTPLPEQDLQEVASLRARHQERFGAAAPVRHVALPGEERGRFPAPLVEIQVDAGKGDTRTVSASARASEVSADMAAFLCVEPAGKPRQAARVRLQPRGDRCAAQAVLGSAGGTVRLEFVRRDGTALLHPDPATAMPFVLVPPRRGAELLPAPGAAEELDSLSAEDLARCSCVLVGSGATLEEAAWTSLLRMAGGGATVVVFAGAEPGRDALPFLPGGLTRAKEPTDRMAWRAPEALASLVEGLPAEWVPGRAHGVLTGGDDAWSKVGEPAVMAVRAHGQGRLLVLQADLLAILGQPTAERVLRNVLRFAGAGDKPALVADAGDGLLPLGLTLAGVPFRLLSQAR